MKGQSLVIQFLMFFLIGLSIFISLGTFFRLQSDVFREDVATSTRKLVNSYLSSVIITFVDSCKECDVVNFSVRIRNTTADYYIEAYLTSLGLNILTQPFGKNYLTTIHNLQYTFTDMSGSASSIEPIILTLIKNQNKLRLE